MKQNFLRKQRAWLYEPSSHNSRTVSYAYGIFLILSMFLALPIFLQAKEIVEVHASMQSFTAIEVKGAGVLRLSISQAKQQDLRFIGEEEDLADIGYYIKNGTLRIQLAGKQVDVELRGYIEIVRFFGYSLYYKKLGILPYFSLRLRSRGTQVLVAIKLPKLRSLKVSAAKRVEILSDETNETKKFQFTSLNIQLQDVARAKFVIEGKRLSMTAKNTPNLKLENEAEYAYYRLLGQTFADIKGAVETSDSVLSEESVLRASSLRIQKLSLKTTASSQAYVLVDTLLFVRALEQSKIEYSGKAKLSALLVDDTARLLAR